MTKLAYSIYEFANAYSVGRSKVYEEIREGRLRIIKVGKRTLIPVEAAAEWQRVLEENSPAAAKQWRLRIRAQTAGAGSEDM